MVNDGGAACYLRYIHPTNGSAGRSRVTIVRILSKKYVVNGGQGILNVLVRDRSMLPQMENCIRITVGGGRQMEMVLDDIKAITEGRR